MTTLSRIVVAGTVLSATAGLFAQSNPAPAPEPQPQTVTDAATSPSITDDARDRWTIRLDPSVWWVSPSGKVKLPGSGASDTVRLERLNLDTPRFTPAGSVGINADNWRFSFFGAGYQHDTTTTADSTFRLGNVNVSSGDTISAQFDFNVFEVKAGYRFLSYDFKKRSTNKAEAADMFVDVYGLIGGRFYDMDIRVETTGPSGTSSQTDPFFGEAIGGARAELHIVQDFTINLEVTGGGYGDSDRSSYSWDIAASFEWNPFANVGMFIGWRQIAYRFEDGDGVGEFKYNGAMAGVFTGIVIRF